VSREREKAHLLEKEALERCFSDEKETREQAFEAQKKERDDTIGSLHERAQRDNATMEAQKTEMLTAQDQIKDQASQIAVLDSRGARLAAAAAASWTRHPIRASDFRPLRFLRVISSTQPQRPELLVQSTYDTVTVSEDGCNGFRYGGFDHVFDQRYENKDINFAMQGLLDHVHRGHKSLVLTDGYSGSGKTSTLLWKGKGHNTVAQFVGVSLLEMYKMVVISASEITDKEVEIRRMEPGRRKSVQVDYREEGRAHGRYLVENRKGLDAVLRHIDGVREKRATAQNDSSSRSHVKVCIYGGGGDGRFYLLDVCGGEEGEEDSIKINTGRSDLRTYVQKCGDRDGQPAKNHVASKHLLPVHAPR
jgi:hypothetical protein